MSRVLAVGVLSAMMLIGVAGALFTVFVLVFLGPYFLHVARSPSSQTECGRIHNGMSANEALAVFDTSSPPYDEGYSTDRKSTRLNSSHLVISYAVFCLKKKTISR